LAAMGLDDVDKNKRLLKKCNGNVQQVVEQYFVDVGPERPANQAYDENLPIVPFEEEQRQLAGMGFSDKERNLPLLEKHNGNVELVLQALLRQSADGPIKPSAAAWDAPEPEPRRDPPKPNNYSLYDAPDDYSDYPQYVEDPYVNRGPVQRNDDDRRGPVRRDDDDRRAPARRDDHDDRRAPVRRDDDDRRVSPRRDDYDDRRAPAYEDDRRAPARRDDYDDRRAAPARRDDYDDRRAAPARRDDQDDRRNVARRDNDDDRRAPARRDDNPRASPRQDDLYRDQLRELSAMGFTNKDENIRLLDRYNGDVQRTLGH